MNETWENEVQRIVCDFVQDDEELGTLLLEHSEPYWMRCCAKGWTPQRALDFVVGELQRTGMGETYRTLLARNWPCDRRSAWRDDDG